MRRFGEEKGEQIQMTPLGNLTFAIAQVLDIAIDIMFFL